MAGLRVRLEFAPELVTKNMATAGLQRAWYEPQRANAGTVADLAAEVVQRFSLLVPGGSQGLVLRCGGFTLPPRQRLTLLRDNDVIFVCPAPPPLTARQILQRVGQSAAGPSSAAAGAAPAGSAEEEEDAEAVDDAPRPCLVCSDKCGAEMQVPLSRMREHIGGHILLGDIPPSACGFCGQVGTCRTTLEKSRSTMWPASNCQYYHKFNAKALLKSECKMPRCTNAPLLCTGCRRPDAFVWKYGMAAHWHRCHPQQLQQFPPHFQLASSEADVVKRRLLKRKHFDAELPPDLLPVRRTASTPQQQEPPQRPLLASHPEVTAATVAVFGHYSLPPSGAMGDDGPGGSSGAAAIVATGAAAAAAAASGGFRRAATMPQPRLESGAAFEWDGRLTHRTYAQRRPPPIGVPHVPLGVLDNAPPGSGVAAEMGEPHSERSSLAETLELPAATRSATNSETAPAGHAVLPLGGTEGADEAEQLDHHHHHQRGGISAAAGSHHHHHLHHPHHQPSPHHHHPALRRSVVTDDASSFDLFFQSESPGAGSVPPAALPPRLSDSLRSQDGTSPECDERDGRQYHRERDSVERNVRQYHRERDNNSERDGEHSSTDQDLSTGPKVSGGGGGGYHANLAKGSMQTGSPVGGAFVPRAVGHPVGGAVLSSSFQHRPAPLAPPRPALFNPFAAMALSMQQTEAGTAAAATPAAAATVAASSPAI